MGTDLITAAAALNQILYQVGGVTGPAVAGLLIAQFGLPVAYWAEVVAFGAALLLLVALPAMPPPGGVRRGVASIGEGLAFLRGRRALQGTFIVDINAMVFGMPRALFPELAETVFGGGARTVGLLFAAPGAGALIGAVASGWTSRVRYPGRAVLWAVAVWGWPSPGSPPPTRWPSPWCCWPWPVPATWCRRCSATRSCRPPCRRGCGAG
ncbi:MAG: MFS transporter [Acidimicrobiales bacterium]